jgi:ABC-type branched-subunit amino acid transport system ATPase component
VLESGAITRSGTASQIAREPGLARAYLGEVQDSA